MLMLKKKTNLMSIKRQTQMNNQISVHRRNPIFEPVFRLITKSTNQKEAEKKTTHKNLLEE